MDTIGVDRCSQELILKVILSPPESQHKVWADWEVMMDEFEERLLNFVEEYDVDRNGYLDRKEVRRITMSHLKYELGLEEDAKLSEGDRK